MVMHWGQFPSAATTSREAIGMPFTSITSTMDSVLFAERIKS